MIEMKDTTNVRNTTTTTNTLAQKQKRLTNTDMVRHAVAGFQGNSKFHVTWLVAKVNETFTVDLTLAQVKRAMPAYVKNVGDGWLMCKGRAVRS